jgi:hypothetical protein
MPPTVSPPQASLCGTSINQSVLPSCLIAVWNYCTAASMFAWGGAQGCRLQHGPSTTVGAPHDHTQTIQHAVTLYKHPQAAISRLLQVACTEKPLYAKLAAGPARSLLQL